MLYLAHSTVTVPFDSWNALRRLSVLTENSACSYVLLEWTFAVLLHLVNGLRIFPVFIGVAPDGTADPACNLCIARPPRASDNGGGNAHDSNGELIADDLDVLQRMPDVCVRDVHALIERFYKNHDQQVPTR